MERGFSREPNQNSQLREQPDDCRADATLEDSQDKSDGIKPAGILNHGDQNRDDTEAGDQHWDPEACSNLLAGDVGRNLNEDNRDKPKHHCEVVLVAGEFELLLHAQDSGIADVSSVDEVEDIDDHEEDEEVDVGLSCDPPEKAVVDDHGLMGGCKDLFMFFMFFMSNHETLLDMLILSEHALSHCLLVVGIRHWSIQWDGEWFGGGDEVWVENARGSIIL